MNWIRSNMAYLAVGVFWLAALGSGLVIGWLLSDDGSADERRVRQQHIKCCWRRVFGPLCLTLVARPTVTSARRSAIGPKVGGGKTTVIDWGLPR